MRLHELVVQDFVLGFERGHEGVLADVGGLLRVLLVGALDLHLQGLDAGGQEGVQGESVAFGRWEGGAFVEGAVVEEGFSLGGC